MITALYLIARVVFICYGALKEGAQTSERGKEGVVLYASQPDRTLNSRFLWHLLLLNVFAPLFIGQQQHNEHHDKRDDRVAPS